MPLSPGTRIGPYEVLGAIGAGGMGEVYRARDTRLKRDVALKVIPEALTQDRERLARFKREAELLASLNHPHIAAIYGFEEGDGTCAIAMEFVDGGTLADRLADRRHPAPAAAAPSESASRGEAASGGGAPRALEVDDALAIARQVAEALEAAHEKGIVHRDLKPGNIALTADGQVKVLDFGLAKALAPELHAPADLTNSPTLTSPAMTAMGLILGTAAYMSPEQAKGRPADKRSDVWAFGCVLYEMLTGRRPFEGEDVSDTLAAVLRADPDWAALPSELPAPIRTLLQRCLEKDRRKRVGDIAAALFVLNESSLTAHARIAAPIAATRQGRLRERLLWLSLVIIVGAFAYWLSHPRVTLPASYRFQVFAPAGTTINPVGTVTLSPDGRRAVFTVGRSGGQGTALALRSFDTLDSRLLEGTDGALAAFWSPDSRFIGFQADGKLKKIDVNGGPPQPLCDAQALNGGTWGPDGTIVFSPSGTGALMRVSSAGGTPTPVTTLDAARQERSHRWPWFLPDGRHFLFVSQAPTTIHVGSIDSADRMQVLVSSARGVYADGHLLFVRDGTLLEQPFDARALKVTGDAVPVANEVWYNAATAGAGISVSESGVLAFRTGSTREPSQLAWFDRTGKRLGVVGEVTDQMNVTPSVDGRKVAVSQLDPIRNARDIAIYDLTRNGLRTRFTFDPADEFSVAWSPDGSRLAFNSARKNGQLDIYEKAATGVGTERLLLDDPANNVYPTSWSPDGRFLLFHSGNANSPTGNDIFALPMTGDHPVPVPVVQSTFNETNGQFSPDGRWVAFQSSESGRTDIWVVPFAATGPPTATGAPASAPSGKWQVSTAGGNSPRWRQNGKELFYLFDGKLMAAEVRAEGSAFQVGAVRELFSIRARTANWLGLGIGWNYDVSPDGERFLINTVEGEAAPLPITVVVNWVSGLAK